jgi:hypothetical protein
VVLFSKWHDFLLYLFLIEEEIKILEVPQKFAPRSKSKMIAEYRLITAQAQRRREKSI